MVPKSFAQNFTGIWKQDEPYVLTGYIRHKISKGLPLEEITAAEIRTINDTYKSLINYINPDRKPWTKEMQVKYFEELEKKSVAGTLWSALNNDKKYVFNYFPSLTEASLITISGTRPGTDILYHQLSKSHPHLLLRERAHLLLARFLADGNETGWLPSC